MLVLSRCVACGAATAIPYESGTRSKFLSDKKAKPVLVHRSLDALFIALANVINLGMKKVYVSCLHRNFEASLKLLHIS